ncbi:MAG: hypothetical protein LBR66_03550 [Candidatus Symbiothrix sp.]|jgi:hypothetical protein|nr:hypothetical protein [Candidatus Symbiothrix sp.]
MLRVVIPCYNEPEVMQTVESLFACRQSQAAVEIIVVVNSHAIDSAEKVAFNRLSFKLLNDYAVQHNRPDFRLTLYLEENLPGHQTGAGLPRKIGMDNAVAHGTDDDVIISLDADCQVSDNYFCEIERCFEQFGLKSATIAFHHPTENLPPDSPLRQATEAYEEYLHYYRAALEYIGFPYPYFCIGSAFAVKAKTYLQVGGMGKQQAGEDFYFLQKVFPLGKTMFIDGACVYPAARVSERVPFGTGPAIAKMLQTNSLQKYSYPIAAFDDLKQLFDALPALYRSKSSETTKLLQALPDPLQNFLQAEHFFDKLAEINQHTATFESFYKRFFQYFSAFKILKYLNASSPVPHAPAPVSEQYRLLMMRIRDGSEKNIL